MFGTNYSGFSLVYDVGEVGFNHVHNCYSNWNIDMSMSELRRRRRRNEGLIFLGPLNAIPKL